MRRSAARLVLVLAVSVLTAASLRAGTLDVNGFGTLVYTATGAAASNDTIGTGSGGSIVLTDSGETITLAPNAISAGWTGSGTNVVSGPASSAATAIRIDVTDAADTLTLSGPLTVSGDLRIESGGSIVGGPLLTASRIALGAVSGMQTIFTQTSALVARNTTSGPIFVINNGPLSIGWSGAPFPGVQNGAPDDELQLTATNGSLLVSGGATVSSAGYVILDAEGASSDLVLSDVFPTVTVARGGTIELDAGRDILIGNGTNAGLQSSGYAGPCGAVTAFAQRDVVISGGSKITCNAPSIQSVQVSGIHGVTIQDAGSGIDLPLNHCVGPVLLSGGTVTIASASTTASVRASTIGTARGQDDVSFIADDIVLTGPATIETGDGVNIVPGTPTRTIDLGTDTPGSLGLTNAELATVSLLRNITIQPQKQGDATPIVISAPVHVTSGLVLTAGSGGLTGTGSGALTVDGYFALGVEDPAGVTWTITPTTISAGHGTFGFGGNRLDVAGYVGPDTFNVNPSATKQIRVFGATPDPPATPGDTLHLDLSGVPSPSEAVAWTSTGFQGLVGSGTSQIFYFDGIEAPVANPPVVNAGFFPASIAPGATTTFHVALSNQNCCTALTGVGFTVTLPAGLQVATPANVVNACGGTALASGNTISVSGATLSISSGCGVYVDVQGIAPGTQVATIAATSLEGGNSAPVQASVTVAASADLSVTKSGAATGLVGNDLVYDITVANAGPSDAANVTLTDALPAGITFGSLAQSSGPAFTCTTPAAGANGSVGCTVPTLASGSSAAFQITVHLTPAAAGVVANTATVAASTADPASTNNAATAGTTVTFKVGDVNGDGDVTFADVIYLIQYLFSGGPAPIGSGDVNGDGTVSIADVFYLVNFLYLGGPAPGGAP